MQHMNKLTGFALALTLAGFTAGAAANDADRPVSLTVAAGVNLMEDIEVGGADLEMDAGVGMAVGVDYNVNRSVSVGFETGFRYNELKDAVDGEWIGQVPLLATVALRYENESKFVPYVALGVGGAWMIAGDDFDEADDLVFAWQGEVGVRYKLGEDCSVGLAYKYLWVDDQSYDFGGPAVEVGDVASHLIAVSFGWSF